MSDTNYLKSVDMREGSKTKGKVVNVFAEKNGEYAYIDPSGSWVKSPHLKRIFDTGEGAGGKVIPASKADVDNFIKEKKSTKKAVKADEEIVEEIKPEPTTEDENPVDEA